VWKPGPDWWVKIGDFGISKRAGDQTALRTRIGTDHYLAPEVKGIFARSRKRQSLAGGTDETFTLTVDVWALGETVHRMITLQHVFSQRTLFAYVVDNQLFPVVELSKSGVSKGCIDFISGAMAAHPGDRWTIQQAKTHHWLQSLTDLPKPDEPSFNSNRYGNMTYK
jgi:serine/threonine protein kinase